MSRPHRRSLLKLASCHTNVQGDVQAAGNAHAYCVSIAIDLTSLTFFMLTCIIQHALAVMQRICYQLQVDKRRRYLLAIKAKEASTCSRYSKMIAAMLGGAVMKRSEKSLIDSVNTQVLLIAAIDKFCNTADEEVSHCFHRVQLS